MMDQNRSGSSQVFVHQHCAFPTITRASGKTSSYKTVNLSDDGSISEQGGWGDAELEKELLTIWAILLRFYVVNDIVAFLSIAPIADDTPKDVTKDAQLEGALQRSRIHLCYDIPDHIRLCDVKVAFKDSYKTGEINATVNTAVAFSKRSCSNRAGLASVLKDLEAERHVCLDSCGCFLLAILSELIT